MQPATTCLLFDIFEIIIFKSNSLKYTITLINNYNSHRFAINGPLVDTMEVLLWRNFNFGSIIGTGMADLCQKPLLVDEPKNKTLKVILIK